MPARFFAPDIWHTTLDRYAEVTGLTIELFASDGRLVLASTHPTPIAELFRKHHFDPGLFAKCAQRSLRKTVDRTAIVVSEEHGLTVVGTSLMLEGAIVGAAVAGYAFTGFSQVDRVQRWARSAGVPFSSLWNIARQLPPVPARRLLLHGELLQVLGDALLRENHRTRQYEDAVRKLQEAIAAKDEFLAVISHELRTPLTPILGWAGVLKKNQDPEQVRRAAGIIERNVLQQKRLIDDLLDMNLTTRGMIKLDLKVMKLAPCVLAALETSSEDIDKKAIRLEFDDSGAPLYIAADSGRLQQIFRNIISNAVKFTPEGGTVRIAITGEPGIAKVEVTDTGVGITPAFLPSVFDIFRQQDDGIRREYEGLGIGLALVKKITELHHGTISVASAGFGRGTEVVVRFPLAAAPQGTVADSATSTPVTLAGISLLVVDDVDDARETLRILLQQVGASVAVASGGREALDMLRHSLPDLVLCDLRMPEMDGFAFIRELHAAGPTMHLPVVAVSALTSAADRKHTREAGFRGHIDKPFDEATIVAAVDAALHAMPDAMAGVEAGS